MFKKAVFWLVLFGLINSSSAFAQENVKSANIPGLFYQAASQRGVDAVLKLIQSGYNIEQANEDGYTALCLALKDNNKKAFKKRFR